MGSHRLTKQLKEEKEYWEYRAPPGWVVGGWTGKVAVHYNKIEDGVIVDTASLSGATLRLFEEMHNQITLLEESLEEV